MTKKKTAFIYICHHELIICLNWHLFQVLQRSLTKRFYLAQFRKRQKQKQKHIHRVEEHCIGKLWIKIFVFTIFFNKFIEFFFYLNLSSHICKLRDVESVIVDLWGGVGGSKLTPSGKYFLQNTIMCTYAIYMYLNPCTI